MSVRSITLDGKSANYCEISGKFRTVVNANFDDRCIPMRLTNFFEYRALHFAQSAPIGIEVVNRSAVTES